MFQQAHLITLTAILSSAIALPSAQVPGDVIPIGSNGEALDGSSLLFNSSTVSQDVPSIAARGDPNYGFLCRPEPNYKNGLATCYIEKRTNERFGWQQKITQEMQCTTTKGCKSETQYSYQATTSFTLSTGMSLDVGVTSGAFTASRSASIGASWSWTKAVTTGTTAGVELAEGERGYLAFWPRIHESCGILAITQLSPKDFKGPPPFPLPWGGRAGQVNDQDACGIAPMYLENGQADGIVKFCYTDGPKRGQGCEHPTVPANQPLKQTQRVG